MPDLLSPEIKSALAAIRTLAPNEIAAAYEHIPENLRPSADFLATLKLDELVMAQRLCLLLMATTQGTRCPRDFQLRSAIAALTQHDCLVDAGTGSGKTLCMILPLLMDPSGITIMVTPLKRLQAAQVAEFACYGIETIPINEDTPKHDKDLWERISDGSILHLLVQPEQLTKVHNHLPKLAQIIRDNRKFVKQIKRFNIDEAHFIVTAGMDQHGVQGCQKAWGCLGEAHVIASLAFGSTYVSIKLSSNRPNTIYATYPIAESLVKYWNLDFLIPYSYDPTARPRRKILVFVDNRNESAKVRDYLDGLLPPEQRNMGVLTFMISTLLFSMGFAVIWLECFNEVAAVDESPLAKLSFLYFMSPGF
ncbi:hypothetical protein ONZ45_g629 [Pleurotus djamor]|nr:hypothetical protein ONZ45_g629 [Pleurotus djamor]